MCVFICAYMCVYFMHETNKNNRIDVMTAAMANVSMQLSNRCIVIATKVQFDCSYFV